MLKVSRIESDPLDIYPSVDIIGRGQVAISGTENTVRMGDLVQNVLGTAAYPLYTRPLGFTITQPSPMQFSGETVLGGLYYSKDSRGIPSDAVVLHTQYITFNGDTVYTMSRATDGKMLLTLAGTLTGGK